MKKAETNPRAAAHASLLAWEKNSRYANLEIHTFLNNTAMTDADRGLYTALVYGVIERLLTLDYIIAGLSNRPFSQIDRDTLGAIRLGIYQLTYMDRIPPHAAVSESVALAPAHSRGFVNAILRSYQRTGCHFRLPDDSPVARLSIEYSTPEALCRFFLSRYGMETTEALLASTLQSHPITLRCNSLRFSPDDILSMHKNDHAALSQIAPDMIRVSSAAHIGEGIERGAYFVQDPASRLCVCALDPQPGETIVDTCAAPGGKTLSAALDMQNRGKILAMDLHENKLSLIRRSAALLGVSIIDAAARDARSPDPSLAGKADRVLCDAPCSGLGVIAKKPDIKYKSMESVAALPTIQYDVLTGASSYVRNGGVLVYSTCTLNPEENEQVVNRFLANHPDFSAVDFDLGSLGSSQNGMRTLYPHLDGCDGFFIAKMIRKTI